VVGILANNEKIKKKEPAATGQTKGELSILI
jgi:hypothetical protein